MLKFNHIRMLSENKTSPTENFRAKKIRADGLMTDV